MANQLASPERQFSPTRDTGRDQPAVRLRRTRHCPGEQMSASSAPVTRSELELVRKVEGAPLGHHFNTFEQEHDAAEFGMWLFLLTELMLFGGPFLAYIFYRTVYSAGFAEGSRHLEVSFGG